MSAPRLVVIAGPDAGSEFDLPAEGMVGREAGAAVFLHDAEASRRHASLVRDDGVMRVADLGSTNGTFVNNERVVEPRVLAEGDILRVGTTVLRYEGPSLPAPRPTVVAPRPTVIAARPTVVLEQVPPAFSPLPLFSAPEPSGGRPSVAGPRLWTLVVVCIGTFMLLLDTTVVNVALPDIEAGLGSSFSDLQWVVNAYALSLAVCLLTAGSVADLVGRRRVFVAGLVVFAIASAACGLSKTPLELNLARAVQGIGGACMFATSLALLANAFRASGRGFAFGVWGATTGAAVALGPLLGGVLTDAFGWESIFFVNLPLSVVALDIALTRVDESHDPDARGVDWLGLITFSPAMFLLVLALIEGNDRGWTSARIVLETVAGLALLVLFFVIESRSRRAMLDLRLFRRPAFCGASIVAFTLSASVFAMFLYLTLYLQTVLGYSPLETGLRFLPITVLAFMLAPVAGALTGKVSPRLFLGLGLALVGGGLVLMHGLTESSGYGDLLGGFLLAGAGIGIINPPLASVAIGVVPPERSGMASGINTTFREAGIGVGIAGLGALFMQRTQDRVASMLAGTPAGSGGRADQLAAQVAAGDAHGALLSVAPANRGVAAHAFNSAFVAGLNEILLVAAAVALVGAVLGFVLVRRRDFVAEVHSGQEPVAEPAPA